jgi:circadian clock protein KaiB
MSGEHFRFCLYVAGQAPNSLLAIDNLTHICETYLPDRFSIEVVDVIAEPERALGEAIYMTPLLVCDSPYPGHRIVGTLSNTEPILQILGLGAAKRREYAGLKDRHDAPQLRQADPPQG